MLLSGRRGADPYSAKPKCRNRKNKRYIFTLGDADQRFAYVLTLANCPKHLFSSYLYYIHRKKIIFDRQALRKSAREI